MARYLMVQHKDTHEEHPDWEFIKVGHENCIDRMIDNVGAVRLSRPIEEWDDRDHIYRPSCMKKAYEFLKRMDPEEPDYCHLEQLLDLLSKEPDYGISNSY